jgi:hypothetical protein
MRIRCRFGASRQVVVEGRSARPHFPHLVTTETGGFLLHGIFLGDFLVGGHLGDLGLDLVDFGFTGKVGLETLNDLLEDLVTLIVHFMSDIQVVGVWATSTKTILAIDNGGLVQE